MEGGLAVSMPVRSCFVIMPIRSEGTEEHLHFLTLYEEWLRPVLIENQFQVERADQINSVGAITQDVVMRLATADLVIADLTDLNPNVFYELGVRHSLRGVGTIMILDEGRTDHIPFDLSAYRVVTFRSDLIGIGKLRRTLADFVTTFQANESERRDNPVHDWLPTLPVNAIAATTGSEAGRLRAQLADAYKRLREYEETYGLTPRQRDDAEAPLAVVMGALQEASQGLLPRDLLRRASTTAGENDIVEFLKVVTRLLQISGHTLAAKDYSTLTTLSTRLELFTVTRAIYQIARKAYPLDPSLRSSELAHFAHSSDPADRERARNELLAECNITFEDGKVTLPAHLSEDNMWSLGLALDAYHRDGLRDQVLALTTAVVAMLPNSTAALRNHARALELMGDSRDVVLEWYKKSLLCDQPDDTSAVWYGNELHNDRRYVDALEVYLVGCMLDINDGATFAHVADELARAIKNRETASTNGPGRILPPEVTVEYVETALVAACSCERLDAAGFGRCIQAAQEAELDVDLEEVLMRVRANTAGSRMKFHQRAHFARSLYGMLRSEVTSDGGSPPTDSAS